jgi:glycosyltransferase involved in cell wall biosynthesis
VIDLHNVVSTIVEQEHALAGHFWQRWLLATDARKARALERRILRAYDRVLVCSKEDAATLRRLQPDAGEKLALVPNGVDRARFRATPIPDEPRVLFPGTLAYPPNVDGARWFCTEVLPRVREAVPQVEVDLVGRDPAPEVLKLGALPNVSIHADVPSMVPYFEAARVVVVPLRIGSGTRLKALEAMASGRPVVGTAAGLEGIGMVDREHALIEDDAGAMADAIRSLLADDELSARLGAAGRAHVQQHFAWNASGDRLVATLTELLDGDEP